MHRLLFSVLILSAPTVLPAQWQLALRHGTASSHGDAGADLDPTHPELQAYRPAMWTLAFARDIGAWRFELDLHRTTADLAEIGSSSSVTTNGVLSAVGGGLAVGIRIAGQPDRASLYVGAGAVVDRWTFDVADNSPRTRAAARARNSITAEQEAAMTHALLEVPSRAAEVLENDGAIQDIAHRVARARDVLYLGRGNCYPIALEGALKLKELSYIHAEGYAAGELKHGPIALIDETLPVVVLAPRGPHYEKVVSNLAEVRARGGKIIAIVNKDDEEISRLAEATFIVPETLDLLTPILTVIPLQLLSYYVAVNRGCNVDQPRNLAKSVTVE